MVRGLSMLLVAGLALCWGTQTHAKIEKVNVGDQAPKWNKLVGADDKQHSLSDLTDAKAVVVVFMCNGCPVAKAYQDRLIQFTEDYKDKGVALVAIHVHKGESADDAKQYATDNKYNFPYIHDESQEVSKNYGAKTTPHTFVLDSQRKIAYMGAFDDEMNPNDVSRNYVRDAVDAVLAGETPATTETRSFGCGVKYRD